MISAGNNSIMNINGTTQQGPNSTNNMPSVINWNGHGMPSIIQQNGQHQSTICYG